jgi:HEAT repeat protein
VAPDPSLPLRTALASGLVTLLLAALTLAFHALSRRRSRLIEERAVELGEQMAGHLTGRVSEEALRERAAAAHEEVFWRALERFADNISGEEWSRLSAALHGLTHVVRERDRLLRGPSWRRAVAARHLGMVDDPDLVEPLRAALFRGGDPVRLSALLALARRGDGAALPWLLEHPEALRALARHLAVAVLKRFGAGFADELRGILDDPGRDESVSVAAAEVLGLWRDPASVPGLERLLRQGDLEERVAAARALGNVGAPGAGDALAAALADGACQVRALAARSLGRLPRPDLVAALEAATGDPAWWVRRNACYALAELSAEGYTALCRIAQLGRDRYAREMALEAFQALEWERVSPEGMDRCGLTRSSGSPTAGSAT